MAATLYRSMVATSPEADRSRANQQAAPSETSAAPRMRAITPAASESSGEPRSARTVSDGASASATPVPASIVAVLVSNDLMR